MEEGKRMFSIFAARMFEQRVLQAYREKVAQERQLQLLRELDDEDKITKDREMKKQNQNQKKKDKKRYVLLLFSCTSETLNIYIYDSRQQKQAKDEERALRAADKAAEEAAAKARQAAFEEGIRMKRVEDRLKREAAKKAAEDEKARKDQERLKRAQDDRERKLIKLRREQEERERKAKVAKEEKAEKERLEKERREKEKEAKEKEAEKEANEKLAAQQRVTAAAISVSTPSSSGKGSTRANNAVASSSTFTTPVKSNNSSTSSVTAPTLQRSPNNSTGSNGNGGVPPKKPANKQNPTVITSPVPPGIVGQSNRPAVQQLNLQQLNLSRPPHLPPAAPITPQQLPHLPPIPQSAGMIYGHPAGMIPPSAMSPRVGNFPPMVYGYGGPNMQQPSPGTPLSPSVLPRGFNGGGSSFDPTFNRGIPVGVGVPLPLGSGSALPPPTPSPIGPPVKAAKPPTQGTTLASTPGSSMLAPGQGRRASAPMQQQGAGNDASGPGPITRPIAPIARPTAGGPAGSNGEATSSGSGSPNRRSPSPKGVLGSSALAADDDEVVSAHGPRRAGSTPIGTIPIGGGPAGQNWGGANPRTILGDASLRGGPWTASAFSSARAAIGPNNHLHQLPLPGPPPVSPSLWGNTPGNGSGENWHPPGFFVPPYMNHNSATSSAPHTST